jgi:hypothetical protein
LRYGEGLPSERVERMQRGCGVPLPSSTQSELLAEALDQGPRQVHEYLLWLAAQGNVVYNDDTRGRIQELKSKLKRGETLREDDPKRVGVNTSVVLSEAAGRPPIVLYFTGPRHAGERLKEVLAGRETDLPPPIQMCDGSDTNTPSDLPTLLANCLSHGRRKFVELASLHGQEVANVLRLLAWVYRADHWAKVFKFTPESRLKFHQQVSEPKMKELSSWMERQFQEKLVEPNSRLGKAIRYMQRLWTPLTLFLRQPGAPLDNNIAERALKQAVRHRKNSLQYKTQRGAEMGDLYMGLIHTCRSCGADPFHYLESLLRNEERAAAEPSSWLPWNYSAQLAASPPPTSGPPINPPAAAAEPAMASS